MKNIQKVFFILLLCSIVILSGCSVFDFFTSDGLLRAPKLTGENAELQRAFENSVGSVSLRSPLTGTYRSAYILKDHDGDGIMEAFVFYVTSEAEKSVRMHVLKLFDDGWQTVADIQGNGSEVYKIDFFNIDSEDDLELAVTWTVSDARKDKTLSVYKLELNGTGDETTVNPLATVRMFDYYVVDTDFDGQNELFYVYFDSSEEKSGAYARLLKASDREAVLYPLSEIKLDMRISGLLNVAYDIANGRCEFFVDCAVGEGLYFTEVIHYTPNDNALMLPLKTVTDDVVAYTRRTALLFTADINLDGLMDIPVETVSEDSHTINPSDGADVPLRLITYRRLNGEKVFDISKYYVNTADNYKLCIDKIEDFSYIVFDPETRVAEFRLKNGPNENGVLFSLKPMSGEAYANTSNGIEIVITELGRSMNLSQRFIESQIE